MWTISNFNQKLEEGKGNQTEIISPSFYTSENGYKMQVCYVISIYLFVFIYRFFTGYIFFRIVIHKSGIKLKYCVVSVFKYRKVLKQIVPY